MAKTWVRGLAVLVGALCCPALAIAQNQCAIPQSLPKSRALFPPPGSTVNAPLTGYVLALSWSPQFCKVHGDDKRNADQCAGPNKFGFILHGLWPDGQGRSDPQWCKRVPAVSPEVMKQHFCAIPSAALMQHEWAKHGSCIENDADRYFHLATRAYAALKFPDMDALIRSQANVGELTAALIAANHGLTSDMVRIQLTPLSWLEEVQICLDRDLQPKSCPPDIGGSSSDSRLRIWPAR